MKIQLKNGKQIEVVPFMDIRVKFMGVTARVTIHQQVRGLLIQAGNAELSKFLGGNVTGKQVCISLTDAEYDRVLGELTLLEAARKENEEADRLAKIAASERRTVLMFSGHYLSDPAQIATMYRDDETGTWYVAERHMEFSTLYPLDATSIGLSDSDMTVGWEARIYEVTPADIEILTSLNAERVQKKADEEQAKEAAGQAKVDAVFAEAKATASPKLLNRSACDHTRRVDGEEYTSVIVEDTYAMPDGTTTTRRYDTH